MTAPEPGRISSASDSECAKPSLQDTLPSYLEDQFADEFALHIEDRDDESEALELPKALLDLTGVKPHRDFEAIERDRWDSGMMMAWKLRATARDDLSVKLRGCHSFKTFAKCDGCRVVAQFWNRCDIFYCPQCSPRLSKRRLDGLMFFVEKMKQPKHLVLTFKNVPTLTKAYLKWCHSKLSKMRRRRIFSAARGGLWAMEITNNGNGWHVHYHLVVDVPWMEIRALAKVWAEVTGDGSRIVYIQDASRGGVRQNLPRYVTKYCGKGFRPQDWSAEALLEFVNAVQGVRTFGVFGDLLGVRSEWREFLKISRLSRRQCACGCCSKTYFSEAELQWHDHFTGFAGSVKPRPPTRVEFEFVNSLRCWPD